MTLLKSSNRLRCRHAFEVATVHANGDVVCSIIDGRGDFVIGNIHRQSLAEVFQSDRAVQLRELVLSTSDSYCRAIGKHCALKGLTLCFDFAHTWGKSRRHPDDLRWLEPHLKPFTALPGEPRQEGW